MSTSFEGVHRHGKVEFLQSPPVDLEGKVIVTFVSAGTIDVAQRGIDETQASDLRECLKPIAGDWDRPEMDAYDAV
jgi:hypothetical protein